ncbi:hypothetical protein [Furfurilactobacillus curtus]|uniref:Membrane protein n=1 Tax=Furfurilactobacillus curtus TaxID=1746200 RepID=A0ABQ5JMB2_9LACO
MKTFKQNGLLFIFFGISAIAFGLLIFPPSGLLVGSDRAFHLQRLLEIYGNLKQGHLTYISTQAFGNAGQGINFFYPWLGLTPFLIGLKIAGPHIIALALGEAIIAFLGLWMNFITIRLSGYAWRTGVIFATGYVFSIYLIEDNVGRFDLGESVAMLFFPLAILSFYHLIYQSEHNYFGKFTWVFLGFSLALITQTHFMTAFITFIGFGLSLIYFIIARRISWSAILRLFAASILYMVATLNFWIPFFDQYLHTKILSPPATNFGTQNGLALSQIINNSLDTRIEVYQLQFGILIVVGCLVLISKWRYLSRIVRITLIIGFGLTIMSTDIFPWSLMTKTVISRLQYSGRMMPMANFFLCYAIAVATGNYLSSLEKSPKIVNRLTLGAIILPVILMVSVTTTLINTENKIHKDQTNTVSATSTMQNVTSNNFRITNAGFKNDIGASIYRDYIPDYGLDRQALLQVDRHLLLVGKQTIRPEDIHVGANTVVYKLETKKPVVQNTTVRLPFWIYNVREYRVIVNHHVSKVTLDRYHLARVRLVNNKVFNTIQIEFVPPKIYKISFVISILTLLFCSLVILTLLFTNLK